MPMQVGALLPDFCIRELVDDGCLGVSMEDVSSCSVDLRVGSKIFQIPGLPDFAGGFNPDALIECSYNAFSSSQLKEGVTITPGPNTYMIELDASVNLPPDVWMETDARSSIGRIDIQCQTYGRGSTRVNRMPLGAKSKHLYMCVFSGSFAGRIRTGDSLTQARLYRGPRAHLPDVELRRLHTEYSGLIGNEDREPVIEDGALVLHADLSGNPPALSAIDEGQVVTLHKKGSHNPALFFRPKQLEPDGSLRLGPREFLLLATKELVRVPYLTAAALNAYRDEYGEFRAHLASWFERGFGFGKEGKASGNVAVFEIRNKSGAPIFISDGQAIGRLVYEYLAYEPEQVYGDFKADTQYQDQKSILLPSFFGPWPEEVAKAS